MFFAVAIVATLAVSLISLALLQAGLASTLLANKASLVNYTSAVNDSSRLRFTLSINSRTLATGEAVQIEVSEQNTFLSTNTVASAHDWPITGLAVGPCGVLNFPSGFAIFQGYHLQNNLSSADRLALYAPGIYSCPAILSNIDSYVFAPGSDSASMNGSCCRNACFTIPMQSEGNFKGYWSGDVHSLSTTTFHSFSPGVDTVVGGDEWGDFLVLYLLVS